MKFGLLLLLTFFSFNSMAQKTHRYDCRMFDAEYLTYDFQNIKDIRLPMITMRAKLETESHVADSSGVESGTALLDYTIQGSNPNSSFNMQNFEFSLKATFIPNDQRTNYSLSKNMVNLQSDLLIINFQIADPLYNKANVQNMTIPASQEYFSFPVYHVMGKVRLDYEKRHIFKFQVECMKPGLMVYPVQ